jgi:P2-related tail formation protein
MSNQVTSTVIGQLTQDKQFTDWWQSQPIASSVAYDLGLILCTAVTADAQR